MQHSVGYCQGLVMLASVFLYVLPPQFALQVPALSLPAPQSRTPLPSFIPAHFIFIFLQGLLHAVGCILPLHYFSPSMSALQVDLAVLDKLLQKHRSDDTGFRVYFA